MSSGQYNSVFTGQQVDDAVKKATNLNDKTLEFSDNTVNNVSTTHHGFVPKLPSVPTGSVLADDGTWKSIGNINGAVTGPTGSVDGHVAIFDGTSGKKIKDTGVVVSGVNTGDQTIFLTGAVTGSGTGSIVTVIPFHSVTEDKLLGTDIHRVGALDTGSIAPGFGPINVGSQSVDGGHFTSHNVGYTFPDGSTQISAYMGAAPGIISLTGDVTGSGTGSIVTTIANNAVTNQKLSGSISENKLIGTDIHRVGALDTGSIVPGFGPINVGTQPITGGTHTGKVFQFDTSVVRPPFNPGQAFWDADAHTISVDLENGSTLQIGQESQILCYNTGTSSITNGTPVYVSGTDGGAFIAVAPAAASGSVERTRVIGLATEPFSPGAYGLVTNLGLVHDIDTSAWSTNTVLYLAAYPAGTLTNVPPSPPYPVIQIGTVIVSSVASGSILVNLQGGQSLNDLSDVTLSAPTTDQILKYNGTEWVNAPAGAVSAGAGVNLYLDGTPTVDNYKSLLRFPTGSVETIKSVVVNNSTAFCEGYVYNQPEYRTQWDGGTWKFDTWCYVDSSNGVSELIYGIYRVQSYTGSVALTGTGTTRTFILSGVDAPLVAGDANANLILASYLQTPSGSFQITGFTNSRTGSCATTAGYGNETGVAYTLHRYKFQVSTGEINQLANTLQAVQSVQPSYPLIPSDTIALRVYGKTTANQNITISYTYNGTLHYSYVETPFYQRHNDLAAVQGMVGNEAYHLSKTQYDTATRAANGTQNGYLTAADWTKFNNSALPDQSGSAGKFLQTNGSTTSWQSVATGSSMPTLPGNSLSYLTTDGTSPAWSSFNASTAGYVSGGATGSGTSVAATERIVFSTGVTAANTVAILSSARKYVSGVHGNTSGYFAGGFTSTGVTTIDKMVFSTEVCNALTTALSGVRLSIAGLSDRKAYGYFCGGETYPGNAAVATTDRISFASEVAAANTAPNLSSARGGASAFSNKASYGYIFGGEASGTQTAVTDRISFSTSISAVNTVSNLSVARYGTGGVADSGVYGYVAGGYSNSFVITADRIIFSTEVTSANTASNLSAARYWVTGVSDNLINGYFLGGMSSGVIMNTGDKINFSSGVTSANASSNLSVAKSHAAGISNSVQALAAPVPLPDQTGNSNKYLSTNGTEAVWQTVATGSSLPAQTGNSGKYLTTDGSTPSWDNLGNSVPNYTASIYGYSAGGAAGSIVVATDRTTFSTGVTAANASSNLSAARTSLTGLSDNVAYGYFSGGDSGGTKYATTDRITFSTGVTAVRTSANLTVARGWPGGLSDNSLYGYFSGGLTTTRVVTTDKVTFSTSTTAASTVSNLGTAMMAPGSVSDNSSYGYLGGGDTGTHVASTNRLVFSTGVYAINTVSNLSLARSVLTGISDNSTNGYFLGGTSSANTAVADKIVFSTGVTSVNTVSNLSQARQALGGLSDSNTYGYATGGYVASNVATVDRISFSTGATSANTASNLTAAKQAFGSVSDNFGVSTTRVSFMRWRGSFATPPYLGLSGGDTYYNTSDSKVYTYAGSSWIALT